MLPKLTSTRSEDRSFSDFAVTKLQQQLHSTIYGMFVGDYWEEIQLDMFDDTDRILSIWHGSHFTGE